MWFSAALLLPLFVSAGALATPTAARANDIAFNPPVDVLSARDTLEARALEAGAEDLAKRA
jgi:hypothetical protein